MFPWAIRSRVTIRVAAFSAADRSPKTSRRKSKVLLRLSIALAPTARERERESVSLASDVEVEKCQYSGSAVWTERFQKRGDLTTTRPSTVSYSFQTGSASFVRDKCQIPSAPSHRRLTCLVASLLSLARVVGRHADGSMVDTPGSSASRWRVADRRSNSRSVDHPRGVSRHSHRESAAEPDYARASTDSHTNGYLNFLYIFPFWNFAFVLYAQFFLARSRLFGDGVGRDPFGRKDSLYF